MGTLFSKLQSVSNGFAGASTDVSYQVNEGMLVGYQHNGAFGSVSVASGATLALVGLACSGYAMRRRR